MALPTLLPKTSTLKKTADRRSRKIVDPPDYSNVDKLNTEKLIIEQIGLQQLQLHLSLQQPDLILRNFQKINITPSLI